MQDEKNKKPKPPAPEGAEANKYDADEEKLRTVFVDEEVSDDEEDEAEKAPQNKSTYTVTSQLIASEQNGLAPVSIASEMRKSFLEYAMSVIVSRALPDARDGLKPVHRRILYGMFEIGINSASAHKKSARIVGDVLGKYHPHGDVSVYDAMVRLAQDFSMRYPMIDGHGNFGSIDGDGAAAMRYTEARMSKIAELMVENIKKDTVNFVPNYDGSDSEPAVLPARIPNLLVSGSTGIAVGMSTSIPPHNLGEVLDGAIALAQNPELSDEVLLSIVKGPDFPTGATILGIAGIRAAYLTGHGSITVRSRTNFEELKNGRTRIIVTEIPYMVNKAAMITKIAELVKDKAIEGITDLRDESSRKGIRVVIELSRSVVPEVVLNRLFKLTQLQTNFAVNTLALVDGQPRVLTLRDALSVYLEHQIDVVTRRSKFDLEKATARAHILEGLTIAVDDQNVDRVIALIRQSNTDQDAQQALMRAFKLSPTQAVAITEMRLSRFTGLAKDKMAEELVALKGEISKLQAILGTRSLLINLIVAELNEIKQRFADARRTEIIEASGLIEDEDLIPRKDIAIIVTTNSYVKRLPLEEYAVQNRGGVGVKTMSTYADDDVEKIVTTSTHTDILVFTSLGKVYRLRGHQIPEFSKQAKGVPFVNLIPAISKDERVVSLLAVDNYEPGQFLLTTTRHGVIKKTPLEEYSRININGKIALGMREDDMLINALIVRDEDEVIIGSSAGKVVRFSSANVRAMGRTAVGVRGIRLDDEAVVVGASKIFAGALVLALGEDGFGKLTPIEAYRSTNRGAKGVVSLNVSKAGQLKFVEVTRGEEDILVVTKQGVVIRTSLTQVAHSSRGTKGVKIINLKGTNAIKSVAVINMVEVAAKAEAALRRTQEISLAALQATQVVALDPSLATKTRFVDHDSDDDEANK